MASLPQLPNSSSPKPASVANIQRAHVFIASDKEHSQIRPAWLSILSCLRWKYIHSEDEVPPDTLSAFYGANCLLLEVLPQDAKWCDVEQSVIRIDTNYGPGLIVRGKLLRRRKEVDVTIVAEDEAKRDVWADILRMRATPWKLLSRRVEELRVSGLTIDEARQTLGCIEATKKVQSRIFVTSAPGVPVVFGDTGSFSMDGTSAVPYFVEIMKESVDLGVSVVLDMIKETRRTARELPRILQKVDDLHNEVVNSMVPVLHPEGRVDVESIKHMFEVQDEASNMLYEVEKRMMYGKMRSLLGSSDLRKIEATVEQLEERVVCAVRTSSVSVNTASVSHQEDTLVRNDSQSEPLQDAWDEFRNQRTSLSLEKLCETTITSENCSVSLNEWCLGHFLLIEAVKQGEIPPTRDYKCAPVHWLKVLYRHCSTLQIGEADIDFVTSLFREAENHGLIACGGADNFIYDIRLRQDIDKEKRFTANALWHLLMHQVEQDDRIRQLYLRHEEQEVKVQDLLHFKRVQQLTALVNAILSCIPFCGALITNAFAASVTVLNEINLHDVVDSLLSVTKDTVAGVASDQLVDRFLQRGNFVLSEEQWKKIPKEQKDAVADAARSFGLSVDELREKVRDAATECVPKQDERESKVGLNNAISLVQENTNRICTILSNQSAGPSKNHEVEQDEQSDSRAKVERRKKVYDVLGKLVLTMEELTEQLDELRNESI